MSIKTMKNAMALGAGGALIAGAVVIDTASPSWAAPVLSNTAAVRAAALNQVTDVRYYHRGYHGHGYYRRGYGYPWWGDPYAYPYSYPYANSYPYPYFYSFPFAFDYGWSWGVW